MKNFFNLFGIIALVAVIGFSFAACGGGGPQTATYTGSRSAGTVTYTLKIIENSARYVTQIGDNYELTGEGRTSRGTVAGVQNVTIEQVNLTLKPANSARTFNATISPNGLVYLGGSWTADDGTIRTGPGALTPTGGSGGVSTSNTNFIGTWRGNYIERETGQNLSVDVTWVFRADWTWSSTTTSAAGTINAIGTYTVQGNVVTVTNTTHRITATATRTSNTLQIPVRRNITGDQYMTATLRRGS